MTQTAQKTGKIIIVLMFTQALTLSVVDLGYAEQPCDPALGICLLPTRPEPPSDEEFLKLFEMEEEQPLQLARVEHGSMVKQQTLECHRAPMDNNDLTFADKLAGEFYSLGEHIILKAKEAGMLLQLPNFVVNFMETCGIQIDRAGSCGDERLSSRGTPRIPYNRQMAYCTEES